LLFVSERENFCILASREVVNNLADAKIVSSTRYFEVVIYGKKLQRCRGAEVQRKKRDKREKSHRRHDYCKKFLESPN